MADNQHYIPPKIYPHVAQKTDPLLIRLDKLSLLVGGSNFYAKIQTGSYWVGFKIYVSGIGNAVYEQAVSDSRIRQTKTGNVTIDSTAQYDRIASLASDWLDSIESAIVDAKVEAGIGKEIEALRWQLHYDITKTDAVLPDYVDIDKSYTINDMSAANTLAISTLDSNLSDSNSGSIIGVATAITGLDTNLTDATTGVIPVSANTITQAVSTVAGNLRGENEYTISKALRDTATSDNSVSYSVYQQTQLESTQFGSLSSDIGTLAGNVSGVQTSVGSVLTNLGTVSDSTSTNTVNGKLNKVNGLVGTSGDTTTATLFGYNKVLNDNISSSGSSSAGDITTIKTNVNTIMTRMGTPTDSRSASTLGGKINDVNAKLGDTTNAGNIWWDILHNAGTSPNTAGYDPNSVVDKIIQAVSA